MKEDKKEKKPTKNKNIKNVKNVKKVKNIAKPNGNKTTNANNKKIDVKTTEEKKLVVEAKKEEKNLVVEAKKEEKNDVKQTDKIGEKNEHKAEKTEEKVENNIEKETNKIEVKKLEKKEEPKEISSYEKMKGLSRAISFLARIMEIVMKIGIVALMIVAVAIPFLLRKFEFTRSYVVFNDHIIDYSIENNRLNFVEQGKEITSIQLVNVDNVNDITELLASKSNFEIGLYLIIIIISGACVLFIMALLFKTIYKLFDNIAKEKTPFIKNNIVLIRKIVILVVALLVLPYVVGLIFGLTTGIWTNVDIKILDIIMILIILVSSYIFEYGCELQSEVNKKDN